MEATLYVLKVAGLAIAAVLGIPGTIHDYRDKITGRPLNRLGEVGDIWSRDFHLRRHRGAGD